MSAAAAVLDLRRQLDRRFPDAAPVQHGTRGVVATAIGGLDAALPAGGLPRGKVTLWKPGGAATAILRAACGSALAGGERAAWVDGAGVIAGAYWPEGGEAPLLLRPREDLVLSCAEELLRSGGFALVVVTGSGSGSGSGSGLGDAEGVRLGRAAREGGSAFVVVAEGIAVSHLRARSELDPAGFRWRKDPFGEPVSLESVAVVARVESMGRNRRARFTLPVEHHDVRMSLDPRLVDRRGVRR